MILASLSQWKNQIAVQREIKARTILLQSLPEDHMADFHHLDDAKDIWLAVKARFGGNEESKKMRKSMLKQEFADFKISESEGLHKGYDRFQKVLSQLNQMQARPDNEDCNMKFLRALPPSWSQLWIQEFPASSYSTQLSLVQAGLAPIPSNVLENNLTSKMEDGNACLFESIDLKKAGRKQSKELGKSEEPKALVSVDSMLNWSDHESEDIEKELLKSMGYSHDMGDDTDHSLLVMLLMVGGLRSDGYSDAENLNLHSWGFPLRSKFGLGYGDTFGSDEVFDLSAPSIFDSCLKDAIEKPLYDWMSNCLECMLYLPPYNWNKSCLLPTSLDIDDHTIVPMVSKSNNYSELTLNRPRSVPAGRIISLLVSRKQTQNICSAVPKSSLGRPGSYNQMAMDEGEDDDCWIFSYWIHKAGQVSSDLGLPCILMLYFVVYNCMTTPHTNKDIGIVEMDCSRSMTGNKEKLADFVKIKGGTVTFGGGDGKITGKGTIRTSNFNFENVYYVEELQNFNFLCVTNLYTKNKVLFTDSECLVLSKEFKLPDSSQVVRHT
ncbi:hypothetical protein Tco_1237857 [Tanacetum coccineum]